jgi:hypothetical protein
VTIAQQQPPNEQSKYENDDPDQRIGMLGANCYSKASGAATVIALIAYPSQTGLWRSRQQRPVLGWPGFSLQDDSTLPSHFYHAFRAYLGHRNIQNTTPLYRSGAAAV